VPGERISGVHVYGYFLLLLFTERFNDQKKHTKS